MQNLFKEATNTYSGRRESLSKSNQPKPKHNVNIIVPDCLDEIECVFIGPTDTGVAQNQTIHIENSVTITNDENTLMLDGDCMEDVQTVLNETNISETSENSVIDILVNPKIEDGLSEMDFTEGQILCGKVGNYPYWPCMVNLCHNGKVVQNLGKGNQILVSYFGTIRNYNYLGCKNILNFQTEKQLQYYTKMQFEILGKKKAQKIFASHYVTKEPYRLAWKEAEEALKMNVEERIAKYGIKNYNITPKTKTYKPKRKPNRSQCIDIPSKIPVIEKRLVKKAPLAFAFTQLMMPYHQLNLAYKCCRYCLEMGSVVNCMSGCESFFHKNCLESLKKSANNSGSGDVEKCMECSVKTIRCYYCWEIVDTDNNDLSLCCSVESCRKWYHRMCVTAGSMNEMTKWETHEKLICPRHLCHKCELVSPYPKYKVKDLTVCLMCCATYHTGDWCIPAGSIELSDGEIICPRHLYGGKYSQSVIFPPFVGRVNSMMQNNIFKSKVIHPVDMVIREHIQRADKPANVNWCFQCGKGGVLLCCEACPAAYHIECANLDSIPEHFYCVDCRAYCYRCYGEIVWIKFASYRWWPGQIVHSSSVPENIMAMDHESGQFVVQFFGSREYNWSDQGRVFQYEADDEKHITFENGQKLTSYLQGVTEAGEGFRLRNEAWHDCTAGHVMSASKFIRITMNKYSNTVLPLKRTKSNHQCDCHPRDPVNNCGLLSSCINRELKYECYYKLCLMKDKCQNQNFTRRNYPEQKVFWTGERGWGLKTLEPIVKHQFVNEYVGEIISIEESKERTKFANSNKCTDFYYMGLDNCTLLDARNYANVSRFINHSCDPNLKAEKWIVNSEHRIGLFALRNINVDEELTFDYQLYTQSHDKIPCKCNSKNCSGFLGDAPKNTNSRKILKARMKFPKMEKDESECASKQSASTSSVSFTTEKTYENICFRCGEIADESKDIACAAPYCPKIYHVQCLNLDMKRYNIPTWICPWHHCDICGCLATHFCSWCTSSVCYAHMSDVVYPCAAHGNTVW